MRLCIYSKDGMQAYCFQIPMPWEFPQPIPWQPRGSEVSTPGDPSPWRWVENEHISPDLPRHLSVLAAIDQLAHGLESAERDAIQKVVRDSVRSRKDIPSGATIKFD